VETRLVYLTNDPYSVNIQPVWQGNYNPTLTYTIGQGVYYNNNGYVAKTSVPVNTYPDSHPTYWTLVVNANFTAGSSTPPAPVSTAVKPNDGVAVSGTSVQIAGANSSRNQIWIYNDSSTAVVYLSYGGTATLHTGIRLNPNGGVHTSQLFKGAINAIATGSVTVTVVEV
jgi:hypothetical protein